VNPAENNIPTTKSEELISRERRRMGQLLGSLAVTTVSGFVTYFFPSHAAWQQFTYLLHTVIGVYVALILLPYVRVHFKRTFGIRRPVMVIVGLLAVGLTLALIGTGIHITLFGQRESLRWVYVAHVYAAYAALFALLLHVLGQRIMRLDQRREKAQGWYPSLTWPAVSRVPVALGVAGVAVLAATILYAAMPLRYSNQPAIQPYSTSYGEHPFRPSHTETSTGTFIDVRQITGTDNCATCHSDIAAQWKQSIHAQAAAEQAYQTNVNLLATKKGMAATRYCEGCHAPVALLTGQLSDGGRLDTNGHMHEGVNCRTCHNMSKVVHLKGVASYEFEPEDDYLFANRTGALANQLHNFLVKIQPRQHRRSMGRELVQTPQMCATCHAQFMDESMNSWGWVKMQDDFTAWLNSPYSGQGAQTFAKQQVTRCQDCHMALTAANDPSADKHGMVRGHYMPGANTAIPWHIGNHEQLQRVTDFLQADIVRISFERPSRAEAVESNMPIPANTSIKKEAPPYFYFGEPANLTVVVSNIGVGHDFPGGTTDINEAWIHLRVVDAEQNLVFESGGLTANNDVDPDALFYRTIAIDRAGKHVWKHDLFNMVGDSYKKMIPAGESDVVTYEISVPAWAKSPLSASATVRYRKLNNQYARWVLKRPDAVLPIVDVARSVLSIPVREKPKVAQQVTGPAVRVVARNPQP
jgi:hypothetical protein